MDANEFLGLYVTTSAVLISFLSVFIKIAWNISKTLTALTLHSEYRDKELVYHEERLDSHETKIEQHDRLLYEHQRILQDR